MSRLSKDEMQDYKAKVIKKLNADYSNGLIKSTITRKELDAFAAKHKFDKYPSFLAKEIVGRATFDISSHLDGEFSKNGKSSVTHTETPKSPKIDKKVKVENTPKVSSEDTTIVNFTGKVTTNSTDFDIKSLIPTIDVNYIKFGHFNDIEKIVVSRKFFPVYVSGHSGNGKTSMIDQIHAKHKLPMIRHNINAFTDEEQLIGRQTLTNGNVEVIEGPITLAMRYGFTVLLDEISAANPNTILCLQGILEGKPFYFKLKNELITPKEGFNIIVTDNTKGQGCSSGKYIGTNILNDAFLERFPVMFEQEFPEGKVELAIAKQLMVNLDCYNENILNNLVKWSATIRMTFEGGGSVDLISTRRLAHVIKTYSIYKDIDKAIKLCVARFDDETKEGFYTLWTKIVDPDTVNKASEPSTDESLS